MEQTFLFHRYLDLYTIVCMFCCYVIIAVAVRNIMDRGRSMIPQTFARLSGYLATVILIDVLIVLGNDRLFRMTDTVFMILMTLYYLFITIASQCWFIYYEMILHPERKWTTTKHLKCSIITVANALLLITNGFHHQFFYIEHHRFFFGESIGVEYLLSYGYCAIIVIRMLVQAKKPENDYRAQYVRRLAFLATIPLIGGILQLHSDGYYPLLALAYAISIMAMHMDSIENLVSRDAMTGLNNKGRLMMELNSRMAHRKEGMNVYLFMLDLNRFKGINDSYGHQEGDEALIHFAECLSLAAAKLEHRPFLARYGGDEFSMIIEVPDEEESLAIEREIEEEFAESIGNENSDLRVHSKGLQSNIDEGIWQPSRRKLEKHMRLYRWILKSNYSAAMTEIEAYVRKQRNLTEVKKVMDAVYNTLDEINEKYKKPYRIETSIGVARLTRRVKTVQEFIAIADEDLYQQKKLAHGGKAPR